MIPVFNGAADIGATLTALGDALSETSFSAEIVIVDDGSTDGTAAAVRAVQLACPLRVVQQTNRGRFEARRRGLDEGAGRYCLLLDSRVRLDPGALRFVEEQIRAGATTVWNAHVEIATGGPYAVFWDILTRRAFSTYFAHPRTTSFGLDDFDRYPKGTTCFFAPRELMIAAMDSYTSGYADPRHGNDDTPVIRWIAASARINISPGFGCRYSSRTQLAPFLRHAYHRGAVFVDGHGRRESRWFPLVVGLYASSAAVALLARRKPAVVAAPMLLSSAAGAALSFAEGRPEDAPAMAWVTPLYATAHVAGMWRGLWMLMRARAVPRA